MSSNNKQKIFPSDYEFVEGLYEYRCLSLDQIIENFYGDSEKYVNNRSLCVRLVVVNNKT